MSQEVERKFVLVERPAALDEHPAQRIEQGYLAIDPAGSEVRVRRADGETTLTVKSGVGLVRAEEEIAIDERRFTLLWPLTEGRRVIKTRFLVRLDGGQTAEVDDYGGDLAGLFTAEVEFPDEAAARAFDPPAWLGREVTGDTRYANRTLAVDGRP